MGRELHETNDVHRAREHAVAVSHVERHGGHVIGPSAVTDEDLELVAHVLGTQIVHLAAREWRPIIGGQTTNPAPCERRSICAACPGHVAPAMINIRAHIALIGCAARKPPSRTDHPLYG